MTFCCVCIKKTIVAGRVEHSHTDTQKHLSQCVDCLISPDLHGRKNPSSSQFPFLNVCLSALSLSLYNPVFFPSQHLLVVPTCVYLVVCVCVCTCVFVCLSECLSCQLVAFWMDLLRLFEDFPFLSCCVFLCVCISVHESVWVCVCGLVGSEVIMGDFSLTGASGGQVP